jgi:uncharacterized protein (DUF433 family)
MMARATKQTIELERGEHDQPALTPRTPAEEEALIARFVEPGPLDLGPSEAQLVERGVSVWALINYLHAVGNDIAEAAAGYDLVPEAVEAAIRYYRRHQALIDAKILLNRSYFER